MPELNKSLQAWNTDFFEQTLCDEIRTCETGVLPLHQGTSQGGYVDDSKLAITLISSSDNGNAIQVKIGAFFSELVGGCNCADDPVASNAYCELQVIIDKTSAEADITVLQN